VALSPLNPSSLRGAPGLLAPGLQHPRPHHGSYPPARCWPNPQGRESRDPGSWPQRDTAAHPSRHHLCNVPHRPSCGTHKRLWRHYLPMHLPPEHAAAGQDGSFQIRKSPTHRGGRHQKTQAEVLEPQRALLPGSPRPHLRTGGLTWPEKNPLEPLLGHGAESWPAQLSGLPIALRTIWGGFRGKGGPTAPYLKSPRGPTMLSTLSATSSVCSSRAAPLSLQDPPPPRGALVLQTTGLPSLIPVRALCSETWSQKQDSSQGPGHICVCPTCLLRLFYCSSKFPREKF